MVTKKPKVIPTTGNKVTRQERVDAYKKVKPKIHQVIKDDLVTCHIPRGVPRGSGRHGGYYQASVKGKPVTLKRLVYILHKRREPSESHDIATVCGDPSCCNPAHTCSEEEAITTSRERCLGFLKIEGSENLLPVCCHVPPCQKITDPKSITPVEPSEIKKMSKVVELDSNNNKLKKSKRIFRFKKDPIKIDDLPPEPEPKPGDKKTRKSPLLEWEKLHVRPIGDLSDGVRTRRSFVREREDKAEALEAKIKREREEQKEQEEDDHQEENNDDQEEQNNYEQEDENNDEQEEPQKQLLRRKNKKLKR